MTVLRFCPACGERLLKASVMKYCTYCGQKLADAAGTAKVSGMAGAGRLDNIKAGAAKAGPGERCNSILLKDQPAVEHYSVVLKSNGNQKRVIERLSKVLCRSLTATRMAVELIPCIVLYKSKADAVRAVAKIFEDEKLHYTVIKGDVGPGIPDVRAVLAGLDKEMQYIFHHAPAGLWLGESIRLVIPLVERESGFAALIATDRALYLFNRPFAGNCPDRDIISYSRLADAVLHSGDGGELVLIYKEFGCEEWLKLTDDDSLNELYRIIKQGLSALR